MRGLLLGLPVVAALGAVAAAPAASSREPRVSVSSFPGPIQPDAGTGIGVDRGGRAVAFAASFRESGDRYDASATPTVFLWGRRTGTLRQLTATGPSDQPSVASAVFYRPIGTSTDETTIGRTLVAFRSRGNLAARNADGSAEIFVWDSKTNGITQITDALTGASSDPVIGAQFVPERDANDRYTGNVLVRWRVAFLSTSNLDGDNAAGLPQVFLYDSGMPEVGRLEQISHSAEGAALPPCIDGRGMRVGFVHDGLPIAQDSAPEVYVWDRLRGVRHALPEGAYSFAKPVIDASGRWLAWEVPSLDADVHPLGPWFLIVGDLRSGRSRIHIPLQSAAVHRLPVLGRGRRSVVCLSTDPVDGGALAAERPVLLDPRATFGDPREPRDLGLPGGAYGTPHLQAGARRLFFTSTEDLDGTNAEGRNVLWIAGFSR